MYRSTAQTSSLLLLCLRPHMEGREEGREHTHEEYNDRVGSAIKEIKYARQIMETKCRLKGDL